MKLKEYLAETGQTPEVFAEKLGVAGRSVRRYLAQERWPDLHMVRRISEVTEGAVQANDWVEPAEPPA